MRFFRWAGLSLALISVFCAKTAGAGASISAVSGNIFFGKACPADAATKGRDVCAQEKIGAKSSATYSDAVRLIYPQLKQDGTAADSKTPREEFGGFGSAEDKPASTPLGAGDPLFYLRVADGNSLRLLVLNGNTGLLGYVQAEPELKLMDLVGVAQDQHVSLNADYGVLPVRAGEFVFFANSWHFNSSESYNSYALYLAGAERVRQVYDGPFLYGFSQPNRPECRIGQLLKPLQPLPAGPAGYAGLRLRITEQRVCQGNSREILGPERKFEAELKWDAAKGKYMGGSRELHRLNNCRMEGKPGCG